MIALTVGVAAGCVTRPSWMKPAPTRSWPRTFSEATVASETGRYDVADRRLATFAQAYPNTPEAAESLFWRALFRLDPSNPGASPREAGALLDEYLASPAPRPRDIDARVLRRTAALLELQSKATTAARSEEVTRDKDREEVLQRTKERDEELQRTRDELAKTLAELDRIKRRLAAPKP